MAQFDRCLLCNSTDLKILKNYQKDFLVKCKKCGFVFCKQIPTYEELNDYYTGNYTRDDSISSITLNRYNEIFKHFEKFKKNNTILDVGAGNGHFIQTAKQYGWTAYGTEFDERAVKICAAKGVIMHHGKLDINNYTPGSFDIITSFEVLEHINNPIDEIKKFNYLLRPGGLVYLTTPNYNSISHFLLKEKWTVFNYPEHLSYYTKHTLSKLFTVTGFKIRSIKTQGIGITRLKASAGSSSPNSGIFTTESIRKKTEKSFGAFAKKIINFTLNATQKGDKLKGEFIKIAE